MWILKNVKLRKVCEFCEKCEFWKKKLLLKYVDFCRCMIDEWKQNQNDHDSRGDELPANFPIPMEKRSQIHVHFLDVVQKSICSINPSHKDDFQESHQKQIPGGTFVINQSEHVVTSTSAHAQSEEKSKYANRNYNVF